MRQVSLGSVLAQGLLIALVVAMVVLFVLPTLGTAAAYSVSKAEGHLEAGTRSGPVRHHSGLPGLHQQPGSEHLYHRPVCGYLRRLPVLLDR